MVADTYKNYERVGEPFEKEGKMYVKVKVLCDRCGGTGIWAREIRNGRPYGGGVCYKCGGAKHSIKEVRDYNEKEYKNYCLIRDVAEKRKAKQVEEAAAKKKQEAFDKVFGEGAIYVLTGNTFPIKDELKDAGAQFMKDANWYFKGQIPEQFAEQEHVIITSDEVYEGLEIVHPVVEVFKTKKKATEPQYVDFKGVVDEKFEGEVTLIFMREIPTRFGMTNLFKFVTADNSVVAWFTTTTPSVEMNGKYRLSGKVKDINEYDGLAQGVLTRCKVEAL